MGTRNLTCVVSGNQYVIAQYGQWDGYPSGQGFKVLRFCRERLSTETGRAAFRTALEKCKPVTPERIEQMSAEFNSSEAYFERYPAMSRDLGAEVLGLVSEASEEVIVYLDVEFGSDSLMCEWVYAIDLDNLTLEVFSGANRGSDIRVTKFPALRLLKTYQLNALPSDADFERELEAAGNE